LVVVLVDPQRAMIVVLLALLVGCGDEVGIPFQDTTVAEPEVLERITRPVEGAAVHLVRIVQRGDAYVFDPAEIRVAPGDVVRFVMSGSQPESVAFEAAAASPGAAEFIREHMLHLGVVLTDPGQAYDVSFLAAPPGRYPFHSIPHATEGMRGEVLVVAE
jgi:plastocyanin